MSAPMEEGAEMGSSPSAGDAPSILTLHVKTLKGGTLTVRLARRTAGDTAGEDLTVRDIGLALARAHGIPLADQRLIYKGKVLKAEKRLADYGVDDQDCLHLIVKAAESAAPAPPAPATAAAPTTTTPAASAAMPPLTANNALPPLLPTPFGIPGGLPAGLQIGVGGQPHMFFSQGGVGGAPGQPQPPQQPPLDLGSLIHSMLGMAGLPQQVVGGVPGGPGGAPQPPQQQQQQHITIDLRVPPQAAAGAASPPTSGPAASPTAANPPSVSIGEIPPQLQQQQQQVHFSLPQAQSHPVLSVNAVRSFLTEVAMNIPRLASTPPLSMDPRATTVSAAVQTQPFPETLGGVAQLLSQATQVTTQVAPPLLYRLQTELQHLAQGVPSSAAHPDTPQSRLALQSQLRQLTPGLRRIGDSLRGLATLIEAIQIQPQTGAASLLILPPHLQPGRQVNIAHVPQVMHVTHQVAGGQPIIMNLTPNGLVQQQQQQQSATVPPPAAAVSAAPSSGTVTSGNVAAPAPPAFDLMSLLQQAGPMMGSLMGGLQQATGGASQASQPPVGQQPNPMADIMRALGPNMFAGLQSQGVGPNAQPQPQQQQQVTSPVPSVATAPAPATLSVALPSATLAAIAPASSVAPSGAPDLSSMLSSFMPMIGQIMSNPSAAGGGGSLQNIISGMMESGAAGAALARAPVSAAAAATTTSHAMELDDDEEGDQPASLFDMFLSNMMQHLSLPDLMGLVSGNWSGMDRVHAPFRELLLDLLAEDDTDANRNLLSHSLATGIVDGMLDAQTLAKVESQLISGQDPTRVSYPVVRRHVRRLLDLILDTPVAAVGVAPSPPVAAFSALVKSWCNDFCGEWLVTLGRCYHDGLTSSQRLASLIVSAKFSGVGDGQFAAFLPMVSGTVTSVMLRAAHAYQQSMLLDEATDGASAPWLAHVTPDQRARWQAVIAADERLLAERATSSSSSASLSSAYLDGGKGGKRASPPN